MLPVVATQCGHLYICSTRGFRL